MAAASGRRAWRQRRRRGSLRRRDGWRACGGHDPPPALRGPAGVDAWPDGATRTPTWRQRATGGRNAAGRPGAPRAPLGSSLTMRPRTATRAAGALPPRPPRPRAEPTTPRSAGAPTAVGDDSGQRAECEPRARGALGEGQRAKGRAEGAAGAAAPEKGRQEAAGRGSGRGWRRRRPSQRRSGHALERGGEEVPRPSGRSEGRAVHSTPGLPPAKHRGATHPSGALLWAEKA